MLEVKPFTIRVESSVLEDLKLRLQRTKLGNSQQFDCRGEDYGQNQSLQESLVEHWRDTYDWRKYEAQLNTFAHFITRVDGLNMHFIHERSRVPGAVPILLLHGWPGSIWEFHSVIRQLSSPEPGRALRLKQAFHVVCPSLPGFAWSQAPSEQGLGVEQMARMMHTLMMGLGYSKYTVQGGDLGAAVCKQLAKQYPYNCVAMHVNMPSVTPPMSFIEALASPGLVANMLVDLSPLGRFTLSNREQDAMQRTMKYFTQGSAYCAMQMTSPHTPGFALSDSPSGLLAWIVEKLQLWTDGKGNVLNALSKDEIITNVMIYWVTGSITSSMRLFKETLLFGGAMCPEYIEVPTGVAVFPKEIALLPKRWIQYSHNLVHYTEFSEGGHFPAWEQPQLFVQDLRQFFHRAMPFDRACELAVQREEKAMNQKPITNLDMATHLLLFAPALPIPAVAALASYLLVSKL